MQDYLENGVSQLVRLPQLLVRSGYNLISAGVFQGAVGIPQDKLALGKSGQAGRCLIAESAGGSP
ncbi:hypothetical protein PsorP6_004626 [Peronosclerospora sorghi]|uniref:Uncharacterized protein n=1 Tax=Peronosclerospora sorghi TaxID=230839 RepID=A0ACC0VPS0_9STRA|nr:hypothetical protein PsorP6_004626 [Peronosclerospora sorghi]